eukprot:9373694-Pyramimonas_sp.AAC.1
MPSVVRALCTILIPKHKPDDRGPSFRGIGCLPSPYRIWSRLRQPFCRVGGMKLRTPHGPPVWQINSRGRIPAVIGS